MYVSKDRDVSFGNAAAVKTKKIRRLDRDPMQDTALVQGAKNLGNHNDVVRKTDSSVESPTVDLS